LGHAWETPAPGSIVQELNELLNEQAVGSSAQQTSPDIPRVYTARLALIILPMFRCWPVNWICWSRPWGMGRRDQSLQVSSS
jgi:hypothetical protein